MWYTLYMSHTMIESQRHTVHLGARGRLVLPAPLRRALDLHEGDRLIVAVEEPGVVRMISARRAARQVRGLLKSHSAGRRLVDELLRDRREEAAHG